MATYFDDLRAQVAATLTVEQGAVELIKGLAAKLEAAGNDPVQIAAIVTQLKDSGDALAQAILENTPNAPAPGSSTTSTGSADAAGGGASG